MQRIGTSTFLLTSHSIYAILFVEQQRRCELLIKEVHSVFFSVRGHENSLLTLINYNEKVLRVSLFRRS